MSKPVTISHLKKEFLSISAFDLDLLLENIIKKPRAFILAHPEFKLSKTQILSLKSKIKKRLKGEPLAYILGRKEFYGLNFKVDKHTLIPRPETELIIEEALNFMARDSRPATFIDVGAGSGCLIITLAKLLKKKNGSPKIKHKFFGIDISKKALEIACQNAKLHKINKKIKFLNGNLLSPIIHNPLFLAHNISFIILANLPYLTREQIKKSPTIKYEPKLALEAGKDGLKYYRKLLKQIVFLFNFLSPSSRLRISAILEIDPGQKIKISRLVKKELPGAKIKIKKDLRGHNRIIVLKIKSRRRK
jgi:release factor glutamine methyltransferase